MATTYTLISSVTVGSGGAANIEFTSIPADYTDLVVMMSARSSRNAGTTDFLKITFNGSTSGFNDRWMFGTGSTITNGIDSASAAFYGPVIPTDATTGSTFGNTFMYIPNYAGSNNKSMSVDSVAENNATASGAGFTAALWSNTAAITSIKVALDVGPNLMQYSTAYLYGISNA